MDKNYKPKKVDRLSFREKENRIVVFNGYTSIFSVLSQDAFFLLNLCDGRTTIEEIIESFAKKHKTDLSKTEKDVMGFLDKLKQRKLIE